MAVIYSIILEKAVCYQIHISRTYITKKILENWGRKFTFKVFSNQITGEYLKCPKKYVVRMLLMFRKWGMSKISRLKKWGISKIKHVISFRTEKREKLKLFDFGAFQKFRANAITCKISPPHTFWGISSTTPYLPKKQSFREVII